MNTAISRNSSVEELLASDCTSCMIAQDKSAYWSPQLYFFDSDKDEYEMVQEVSGHLSYYKFVPHTIDNGDYVMPIAIPNGMRMISGNPFRRNLTIPRPDPPRPWTGPDATQDALSQKAIGFNCLYDPFQQPDKKPEDTLQRHFLPDKEFLETNCRYGIRAEILFPTCWNGKDLESPDLRSHLAYSDSGANGGRCPKGYDVPIMQLLFETIYPTGNFKGRNGYYVFSNGDPTGYGYHGDALIAWEGTTQQDAVRDCGDPDPRNGKFARDGVVEHCPHFKINSPAAQSSCSLAATQYAVKANFQSFATALPGRNPVQFGPQQATMAGPGAIVTPVVSLPSHIVPTAQSVRPRTSNSADPYANQFLQVHGSNHAASTSVSSSSTSTSTPATTPAPALKSDSLPSGERILNTVTHTSNGAVYEVVNVEMVQTTTVWKTHSSMAAQHQRRGDHMRFHRDQIYADAHGHGRR